MESRRLSYRDKLWYAREEVKDLERLLEEAQNRLNQEYENFIPDHPFLNINEKTLYNQLDRLVKNNNLLRLSFSTISSMIKLISGSKYVFPGTRYAIGNFFQ